MIICCECTFTRPRLTPWRLCRSFDTVLDYSKLSAGDFTLDVQPNVDLQSTLDSVTTAIQMKADTGGRGLWVRSYIGTNVPQWYETDAKRLQQILYNLLVCASYIALCGVCDATCVAPWLNHLFFHRATPSSSLATMGVSLTRECLESHPHKLSSNSLCVANPQTLI